MRRFWIALGLAAMGWAAGSGCGASYGERMDKTVENIRFRHRLDKNLEPAPTKGFEQLGIYIRPPKPMKETQEFVFATLPAGEFDFAKTFLDDQTGVSLHVLARYRKPRARKGQPPPKARGAIEPVLVQQVLTSVYGENPAFVPSALKNDTTKKPNVYKRLSFPTANGKEVQVYLHKGDPDVVLIWEIPTAQRTAIASKQSLSLQSFAVGNRAKKAFAGFVTTDENVSGASGGGAAPGVF